MSIARRFHIQPNEYPEVELGLGLTCQIVQLTPELAKEWKGLLFEHQRKEKRFHLASLVEDIVGDRWRLNGETIVFNRKGKVTNGQHRIDAVILAGKPILTVVIRGVDDEAYITHDHTAKRTAGDAIDGLCPNSRALAGTIKLLERYDRKLIHKSALVLSPIAVAEIAEANPGLNESVRFGLKASRACRGTAVPSFCHYVFAQIDREAADGFIGKLATGAELGQGDPILTLRSRLSNSSNGRGLSQDDTIHMIFKAWNAWRKGQKATVLRIGETEALPTPI